MFISHNIRLINPGKVIGELYRDTALRAAFGSGMRTTESNAVACLQAYIDELRRLPVDLLAWLERLERHCSRTSAPPT